MSQPCPVLQEDGSRVAGFECSFLTAVSLHLGRRVSTHALARSKSDMQTAPPLRQPPPRRSCTGLYRTHVAGFSALPARVKGRFRPAGAWDSGRGRPTRSLSSLTCGVRGGGSRGRAFGQPTIRGDLSLPCEALSMRARTIPNSFG